MEIGNRVKIKNGATTWMKEQGFWLECMPENIDNMEGKIVNNYTDLKGNDSHFEIDLGLEYGIGIHPQWLEYKECEFCNNPFSWKTLNETNQEVRVKCTECGNEFTFKNYGRCTHCGFWLDKNGYCEMCED